MRVARRRNAIVSRVAWQGRGAADLADQLVDNIESFVAGRPANLVLGAF